MIALCALVLAVMLGAGAVSAAENRPDFSGETRDAWITGKLESAYVFNEHLNPFDIDIEVDGGEVTLTGRTPSEIDKDLAGRIAEGIDGVTGVDNKLEIDSETRNRPVEAYDTFARWVTDATTSAVIKSRLAANKHIDGLDVGVHTRNGVVTLDGTVQSGKVKDLASIIAKNTDNVKAVENNLKVAR